MLVEGVSEHAEQVLRDVLQARRIVEGTIEADESPVVVPSHLSLRTSEDVARWWDAQQDGILAVIESLIAEGHPDTAVSLLSQVWPIVAAQARAPWPGRLRYCGTRLVDELPTSRVLAQVLRYSAQACRRHEYYQEAELDGMRELAIWRALNDYAGAVDALRHLAETFRSRNRLHRVMDCADQILQWALRQRDEIAVAGAFRDLGLLTVEAGRPDEAIGYLTRARDIIDTLPGVPVVRQAELIARLGTAMWLSGARSKARRRFSEALALLVDVDDAAADRIRVLVGTSSDTPLPVSVMEGMDHL
jgi:tetratricopeptide (TPR) repeat protein